MSALLILMRSLCANHSIWDFTVENFRATKLITKIILSVEFIGSSKRITFCFLIKMNQGVQICFSLSMYNFLLKS